MTQIKLVDINPEIVAAWKEAFANHPEVECIQSDITKIKADVWVTPTNSKGSMSGGVDLAVKKSLGAGIENHIQEAIIVHHDGAMPVGKAVIVPTGNTTNPRYVVATPSMLGESDDLKRTKNTALACAAAFQAIYHASDKAGAEIDSIAIPGLGSGTGRVPPHICADLMLIGYKLFGRKRYSDFDEMLLHLNIELSEAGLPNVAETGEQPSDEFIDKLFENAAQAISEGEAKTTAVTETLSEVILPPDYTFDLKDVTSTVVSKTGSTYIDEMPIGTPIL